MAVAYQAAKKTSKAMLAYEKAHSWRPLFYLATQSEMAEEEIVELAYRVAGEILVLPKGIPSHLAIREPRYTKALDRGGHSLS